MFTKTTLKSLIAVAAIGATLTGMSATAQSRNANDHQTYDQRRDHQTYDQRSDRQIETRIDTLQDRISDGRRANRISMREAKRLTTRLDSINDLKRDYMRTGRGIDRREKSQLNARLDKLSAEVRYERNDRDNRRG